MNNNIYLYFCGSKNCYIKLNLLFVKVLMKMNFTIVDVC